MDWLARLQQYVEARNKGLIDEKEYRQQRAALLEGMEAEIVGRSTPAPPVKEPDKDRIHQISSVPSSKGRILELADTPLCIDTNAVPYDERQIASLPKDAIIFGRYRLEVLETQTSYSVQYRCHDLDVKDKRTLHLFKSSRLGDSNLHDLIEREYEIGKRTKSPHLRSVFHLNLSCDPPYMVTSHLDGVSLKEHLNRHAGSLPIEESLEVTWGLIDGLSQLHRAMIPHLDIRPSTLFLSKNGDLTLVDFGLNARFAENKDALDLYAPPEKLNGQTLDMRADVYSVGMLLSRLVTGTFPFRTKTKEGIRQWHEKRDRHFEDLPEVIREIVATCLESQPGDRYRDIDGLRAALQSATSKRGWHVLPNEVVTEVEQRCHKDRLLINNQVITVKDARLLLNKGAVCPSARTLDSRILLKGDPCALIIAGSATLPDKDPLTEAFAQSVEGDLDFKEWYEAREDLGVQSRVRAAKILAILTDMNSARGIVRKIENEAQTSVEWLAIAESHHSSFDESTDMALALNRAAQSATSTLDHIEIASFIRWYANDKRRTTLVLQRAVESCTAVDDWLSLAEAWAALLDDEHQSKVSIGRAMALLNESEITLQAEKAASAGARLGATPAVIRWGVSLEQRANGSHELLAVEAMWNQMGLEDRADPISARRQKRLHQELTRIRSRLVPLEINLPLPEPPFDEYTVETYANQVEEQKKLHAQAVEIIGRERSFSLASRALTKPYVQAEIDSRLKGLHEQEQLTLRAAELIERAAQMGWDYPAIPSPLSSEQLDSIEQNIAFQEDLDREFHMNVDDSSMLVLPKFPRTVASLDEWKALLGSSELQSRLKPLFDRAALIGWRPDRISLPLAEEVLSDLEARIDVQEEFHGKLADLKERSSAIAYEPVFPAPPHQISSLESMQADIEEQEIQHAQIHIIIAEASRIGFALELPPKPWTAELQCELGESLKLQRELHDRLQIHAERSHNALHWCPPVPKLPCNVEEAAAFSEQIEEQISHYERLKEATKDGSTLQHPHG